MATNLKLACEKGDLQEQPPPTKLQPGDTVLIQNHTRGPFELKYIGDYRVVSLRGNQVEIQPAIGGTTEIKHIKHVKYVLPTDKYINQLPELFTDLEEKLTLRINPDQIPNLHWKLADTYHTTNIGQTEVNSNTVHDITLDTHRDTDYYHIKHRNMYHCKVDMNPFFVPFYLLLRILRYIPYTQ